MTSLKIKLVFLTFMAIFCSQVFAGGGGADGATSLFRCNDHLELEVIQNHWIRFIYDGVYPDAFEIIAESSLISPNNITRGPIYNDQIKVGHYSFDWSVSEVTLELDNSDQPPMLCLKTGQF